METEEIRYRNPVKAIGFVMIPHVLTLYHELSSEAYRLYGLLLMYAQHDDLCYPGVDRLAEDLHQHRDTINVLLDELMRHHLISRQRRFGKSTITWIESIEDNDRYRSLALDIYDRRKNPTSNVGNIRPRMSEKPDAEEEPSEKQPAEKEPDAAPAKEPPANALGLPAVGGGPTSTLGLPKRSIAEILQAAARDGRHSQLEDGEEIDEDGNPDAKKRPQWQIPESDDEKDLLAACHAKWYRQGQKSRARSLVKALQAGDLLKPADCYRMAQKKGATSCLPRAYFEERLKSAREIHWRVNGLLNALEDNEALAAWCQTRLRKEVIGNGRHRQDHEESGGTTNVIVPPGWQ